MPVVTPVVKRLLWINGIIFLVQFLTLRSSAGVVLTEHLALTPQLWVDWFPLAPLWQLLTYGFLHEPITPFHLLYNLLALYFFGTMLEGIIGGKRFLISYLVAIGIGGAFHLAWSLSPLAERNPVYGASGGVLFVIVATATMRPNTQVIFILFPLKLKTLALIMVGIDVFFMVAGGLGVVNSNTAHLVHISGAGFGFLAVRQRWIWSDPLQALADRRQVKQEQNIAADATRLDELLKRIHKDGIHSLSSRDKDFLKRQSRRD
jgi:membrane associated rhomboid family serine protease